MLILSGLFALLCFSVAGLAGAFALGSVVVDEDEVMM
jgi:hypothetical protein